MAGGSTKKADGAKRFAASGFFALRTPLLPFDEILAWSEGLRAPHLEEDSTELAQALDDDRSVLRARLQSMIARPEIREALFVGSPKLDERMASWREAPGGKQGKKFELALIRYFLRMAGRATPFGLFAGCSVGTLGDETALMLADRGRYGRCTRLDMDYLFALTAALEQDPSVRRQLRYAPNSSLYKAAGRLRYVESRQSETGRSHHLVAVEATEYLLSTLARAEGGATPEDLTSALVACEPNVSREEAAEYVEELIDSQILLSDLVPSLTGREAIDNVLACLRGKGISEPHQHLDAVRRSMQRIDARGLGSGPEEYREIAERLRGLPAEVKMPRLFQVDMIKPMERGTLSQALVDEIARGIDVLCRLFGARQRDRLGEFKTAFARRYEGREVSLVEALDEEVGVGFERSEAPGAEASPLLEGLTFVPAERERTVPWDAVDVLLLRKVESASRTQEQEITLTDEEIERVSPADRPELPDALGVLAGLFGDADSPEGYRVVLDGVSGPSGANLLGRFCHADPVLRQHVERHLREEERFRPEAVYAEIVHLPEERTGNILSRPVLREYEVPYLGRSGADREHQIPIMDLLVSVVEGRIVLRSARLDREVIPRLTTAHNIVHPRNTGVYRFLCALQHVGVLAGVSWNWGALQGLTFLPRVVYRGVVLSRARWRLTQEDVGAMSSAEATEMFRIIQRWRRERRMPRFVALADGDNQLPVDLDNILTVETLARLVKERQEAVLVELFPGDAEPGVEGPEGRFCAEVIVPFVRATDPARRPAARGRAQPARERRTFLPGSEWFYAKLYTGTATADEVVREVAGPLARRAITSGAADRWFFIRFGDPDWHVRFRIHGPPGRLYPAVVSALEEATSPLLQDGRLWRVQLDTYEREIERYGGLPGTEMAERVFHADSDAVLSIVETLSGDEGEAARWRLALRGIDALLTDLRLDLNVKDELLKRLRTSFGNEFQANTTWFRRQLGEKYRSLRKDLQVILDADGNDDALGPGYAAIGRRSATLAPIVDALHAAAGAGELETTIPDLAASYVHMHVNRMLRSVHRAQELVLYDLLMRYYESRLARARK